MKTLFFALAIAGATVHPALADPCTALKDQKMTQMTTVDLYKEACKANNLASDNFDKTMQFPSASGEALQAMRDFEQCIGQVQRMQRILKTRVLNTELAGELRAVCEQPSKKKIMDIPTANK